MTRLSISTAVACALLLGAARQTQALWSITEVSPGNTTAGSRTFSVSAEPDDGLQQVRVTVTPVERKPHWPLLSGIVQLRSGERSLGEIDVKEQRNGESSVFTMRLAPEVARNSRFQVYESQGLEGQMFRLDLGKFLAPAKKEK
jgi:hypothetical protein